MPLYEYKCPKHGYFTKNVPVDKRHNVFCPKCGEMAVKVFSKPAFKYVGSGFFATDHVLQDPINPLDDPDN